jgi:hypothetical protein
MLLQRGSKPEPVQKHFAVPEKQEEKKPVAAPVFVSNGKLKQGGESPSVA